MFLMFLLIFIGLSIEEQGLQIKNTNPPKHRPGSLRPASCF